MPNLYIESDGVTKIIKSTSNNKNGKVPTKPVEEITHVADIENWARHGGDIVKPYTAETRFGNNKDLKTIDV